MCKYEHYGNCDPETRDQEYCIFHKPNKNEDEAREFYRKFLKKFEYSIEEKVKVENKALNKEIEVNSRLVFVNNMDCTKYVFPEITYSIDFSFEYVVFKGSVLFVEAIFNNVSFLGAIFEESADFSGATFYGTAIFDETVFKKFTTFESTIFNGIAKFDWSIFKGEVTFEKAIFEGGVTFGGAIFEENKANFNSTTFKGDVQFSNATFEKDADFGYAIFEENTDFKNATFKGNIQFSNAIFEKDADFSGETMFHGKLDFSSVTFRTINIDLPSKCFKHPQAEAEACRVQRICYEREGRKMRQTRCSSERGGL